VYYGKNPDSKMGKALSILKGKGWTSIYATILCIRVAFLHKNPG
jgi:hypothetical protein